ncbi:MAG TPA: hypothetical protein EYN38_10660, partial [Flavobacteriales bacterium]|nr:hypothetical protein [Flavobacteriales bacterium]
MKRAISFPLVAMLIALIFASCKQPADSDVQDDNQVNPLLRGANEIIGFGDLSASNIAGAARISIERAEGELAALKNIENRDF